MWAKLMLNDGINQTCMAYGGTYGSATEPGSEQRRCFVSAMRETLAVANAEGVELTEADLTQMVHLIEGIDPAGMPSMAQDRIAQRKTEVEEFAGTICRLAAKHDIQVPQNDWLYQRIREIESSWQCSAYCSQQIQWQRRRKGHSPRGGFLFHLWPKISFTTVRAATPTPGPHRRDKGQHRRFPAAWPRSARRPQ